MQQFIRVFLVNAARTYIVGEWETRHVEREKWKEDETFIPCHEHFLPSHDYLVAKNICKIKNISFHNVAENVNVQLASLCGAVSAVIVPSVT